MTVSIGVAEPEGGESADVLLDRLAVAAEAAARAGGNCVYAHRAGKAAPANDVLSSGAPKPLLAGAKPEQS
jgi:hypothetical protein